MSLTAAEINLLSEKVADNFQYMYAEVLKNQPIWWQELVMEESTPDRALTETWYQDVFALNESLESTPPQYRKLLGDTIRIPLRRWDNAVRLKLLDVSADRTKTAVRQAQQIGVKAARLPQDLIVDALNLGDTSAVLGFDGLPLFDNAHPKGGTTFDNLLAGVMSETTLAAAQTALAQFPSDEGADAPLGLMMTHVWHPVSLNFTARKLLRNSFVPSGSGEGENVTQGIAKGITDARFGTFDDNDWGVMAVLPGTAPWMRVKHKDYGNPIFVPETDQNGEANKNHEEIRWWMRWYETTVQTKPEFQIKFVNA